ncbi:serine/arginine repetitive matrix protein 2-like isoform X4 [Branchiostoma floridae]|uniref:Serine/arginine repetitive matrix protein 2-like isoform X4 n=1 Tax=Branchiostoma floridae TaxID=7739 RepID=A0A9J7LR80_BRAFL|nr:serine/arginine repetitive matrix protein 2-like isoform X4 [Branchiostoma floridae]
MMESVSSTTGTELTRVQHILGLMQKNLECPICLDLLKNPVSTRCDHQFCRFCILKALTGKQSVSCPLCKVEVTKRSLQDNTQLQQIITAVQSVTEAVYKDTDQQKAPPVGSSQNYSKSQDQKEQGEKRRHISTDSEEGNGVPSTVQVRNRRNIRQAKKRKVEETPVYIEEDPIDDHSAPRTTTNINISHGFPVQELSKGRKNRNLNNPPNREAHRRSAPRRTRHAPRRDGRSSNREQGSGHLEPTVTSAELLSALVENSLGVSGDGHVTNGCHGDDDVTGNADPSAEDGRLLHVLGEASLGLFEQSGAKDIQESTTVLNSGGKVPTIEEHKEDQVGEKPLLTSHDHNDGSHADQEPHGDDQKSDTLGPTISEAEPLDISKDQEQMAVDLLTTEVEDEVPADIGKEVKAQEKVEFWLKHHNTTATEPGGTEDLDPYEFIGSQQDHAKGKKKSRKRGKKGRKPPAADNRNKKSPKSSSGPSKGKPTKTSAKKVEEVEDVEVDCEDLDQEEGEASAASMTDCSEASWKPGQSDPDWGKGRSSRRKSAETNADKESVSSKGRKRKQRNPADREDQMTVSSGSSSQLRIDRWVQRKEKLFVKSYSKPAASDIQSPGRHASGRTPASLRSSGRDSTPGEVPPTPPPPSTPPVLPATISTSGQKAAKDRNRLSIQRRSSQLSSPENTPSICSNSQENTPSTPGVQKSLPTSTKSQPKSSATPPDAVDNEKDTPKSCPPESEVSTVCSQVSTPEVDTDSDVVPDTEENPTKKGKRKSSNLQKASDSEATPRTKVTSPSMMFQQSFPDSGNTEASVSLLENVKPRGAETVSQQKRKSPRLSRGVSDSGKQERKCSDEPKETVTQKLEQSEAEQTNSKRHLKEQRGKEEVKTDNLKPTEKVVGKQASFEGLIQQSNEIEHYDVTDDDKEDLQMEDIEEEDGQEEEDAVEDEDDSEEDDLVPPTPPDTSFTQLTQRTKTVKSKTWTPERVTREDLKENNFQPVILEEEEDRECNWSDDDNDELPDLDEEPEHQVSSTGHSNTATPQNGGRNKAEEQPDAKEGFKENQKDTDINTRSQSKRRKAASGEIEAKDEATDESMPKRRKSDIDSEWKEERIPKVDVVNVTAGFENNEESDLSQDSHVHDLTNASSLSELYDTQNQDKLKNDVQNLEGQMAMIQMLLAKGKERARETGKEENTNKDPTSIAKQHLTTVYEENMQMSEGDHEEILSGKDLYGTPSSQASAKCTYSTAQEETPRKRRPSSTSTPQSNHSPTKEYNFRKRMLSPQRSQEASAKSRKSRQSSPRSSQPCLSPRSPSPPPPLSPEKTRTPRVLPPAVQAAANILEKFRSPDLATKGKRRNSGNSSPLGKEDSTARRLSPRTKKESQSPPDRKNTTPRSSSFKTSASKSPSSPRSKKYDIEKRMNLEDEVEDSMPVENLVSTAARNRRSLNKRKRKSLQDTFADEEDETMRCDDAPSPGDHKIPTSEEPEEMSTNWKAFQQMKCDILAQKGTSTSNGQNKEAPKRLSLPSTMKSDRCTSDKRKSEPVVSSSQFDRNSITNNPSTPQPRKNPLTFSQQPSPSVGNLSQTVSRRKKESPRLIGSSKSPIDRLPHGNTEKLTSTSSCSAVKSVAGPPTVVKTEWQNDNRAPMTFVTTGLSREETRAVHELAKKTGSQVKQSFDNSTTHVITRTDVDLFCSRTLKFFLGIAGRKWIVSFQWIAACLEEGKHVPEDPYEVRGDLVHGCHGGPRQARSNKGKLLLCDYEICIYGKFTALTRDDLQFMVELCGGTVVKEPHMFPHDKKPLIVSQIDANQLTEEDYNVFYRRYGVLSVTRDWILDSVSSYQIQPIERYLMCSTKNQNIIVID